MLVHKVVITRKESDGAVEEQTFEIGDQEVLGRTLATRWTVTEIHVPSLCDKCTNEDCAHTFREWLSNDENGDPCTEAALITTKCSLFEGGVQDA